VAGSLRFEVTKPKINWGTFFQDWMRSGTAGNSRFDDYSGQRPAVVVENAAGEKRVLEVTKTVKAARDRAAIIERDFDTLDTAQWCERYDVPDSFVGG
jgi:hypothetical protein